MARSGHGTDSWSAEQAASETGLNGQSSDGTPKLLELGAFFRQNQRFPEEIRKGR